MGAIAISRMRAMLVGAGQLDVGIATLFCRLFSRIVRKPGGSIKFVVATVTT